MSTQLIVAPFGTQLVDVAIGSRIAIATYGESKASIDIADGVNPTISIRNFTPLSQLSNNEIVLGTYITAKTFQITAGADPVYYAVGTAPFAIAPQRYRMNTHRLFEDFDMYVANDYTITNAATGTIALTDVDGGALLLTNNTSDDNAIFMQKKGESFRFATGKELWFATRFKVSDATQSDVVIGLQITDTSPLDVTDGVFFLKADGSTTVNLLVEKNNTATTTAITTLADDTFVTLAYLYNGVDRIDAYVNGVFVASSVVTNLPDDEDLTISFGIQNGEAAAKTMTIDFYEAEKAR
jgi:hypothetical protein